MGRSLRLNSLYSVIFLRNPLDHGIREPSNEYASKHPSYKRSGSNVSNIAWSEHPRRSGENSCKDDRGADVPAVEKSRCDDGVASRGVGKREERS